ncbi:MAG: ATP-binding protein [Cyanobacteria bacterium P01_D01_bin.156]
MGSINESRYKAACVLSQPFQPRWLSALTSLHYRLGHLDAYLEELVSGLCHGLGASRVMLGQCQHPGDYHFIVSSELQPREPENPHYWSSLAEDIATQTVAGLGAYTLQTGLTVAYCGIPLYTPRNTYCGALLALRPAIEPFHTTDQQVLSLIAQQAVMAIELERSCHHVQPSLSLGDQVVKGEQDRLVAINQQLNQKLDQYRSELQRVSAKLQVEIIAHSALEQRFRTIFDDSNDAIFVIDPSQDKILEANPRAVELLGYSQHELFNCIKISHIYPDEMPRLAAFSQTVVQNGCGWTDELTCLTKTKHKLYTEISAVPIDFDGQSCILAMVRDISERKRLDAEYQEAKSKAQQAISHLAELRELTSMIVYEIRNPLTTILMGLTSFKKLDLDNRFQSRLKIALNEAERLQRLLNEILLFANPQALDCQPLELNKWSVDLLKSLQMNPVVASRKIQFCANPIATIVLADSDRLKQVFVNLIVNACEAVKPGDEVLWEIAHSSKADSLTVEIKNGGSPIPPSILQKITTPFFTTKSTGNGLGLAIVQRLIKAHQGELSIASDVQDGTTVTVKLPLLKR